MEISYVISYVNVTEVYTFIRLVHGATVSFHPDVQSLRGNDWLTFLNRKSNLIMCDLDQS